MGILILFGCFQVGISIESLMKNLKGCDGKPRVSFYDINAWGSDFGVSAFDLQKVYDGAGGGGRGM